MRVPGRKRCCPLGEPLLDSLAPFLPNSAEFGAKFPRPNAGHILPLMNPHAPWRWLHAIFSFEILAGLGSKMLSNSATH